MPARRSDNLTTGARYGGPQRALMSMIRREQDRQRRQVRVLDVLDHSIAARTLTNITPQIATLSQAPHVVVPGRAECGSGALGHPYQTLPIYWRDQKASNFRRPVYSLYGKHHTTIKMLVIVLALSFIGLAAAQGSVNVTTETLALRCVTQSGPSSRALLETKTKTPALTTRVCCLRPGSRR